MRQYTSSPRKEKSGYEKYDKREKTVPARSAKEIEVKGKMEERTERESDSRRREVTDLLVLQRPAKSLQNGTGFSRKT